MQMILTVETCYNELDEGGTEVLSKVNGRKTAKLSAREACYKKAFDLVLEHADSEEADEMAENSEGETYEEKFEDLVSRLEEKTEVTYELLDPPTS